MTQLLLPREIPAAALAKLSRTEREELLELLGEVERRSQMRQIYGMYPDEGPLRRALYPKHMEFFRAGLTHRERAMVAANRVGKTLGCGGYETVLHLTGEYPHWWDGRRFDQPIRAWAAGKTNETTRDIIQQTLLGAVVPHAARKGVSGTGLVPGHLIGRGSWKQGVPDLIDRITIRHVPTGGWSTLGLKSYEQGRGSFEGTSQELVWLDEEPSMAVYNECLIRTATTNGIVMVTFTPLEGMSEVAMLFMPKGYRPGDSK